MNKLKEKGLTLTELMITVVIIGVVVFAALILSGGSVISAEDKADALSQCQAGFASDFKNPRHFKTSKESIESITYSLVTFGVPGNSGRYSADVMGTLNAYSLVFFGIPLQRTVSLDFMGTIKFAGNPETKNVDYNCKFLYPLGGPLNLYWNVRMS